MPEHKEPEHRKPDHKEFEIAREFEVDATPQQVWDALTTGTAGWLWPVEYEPREGGAAPYGGTVVTWDPPHRLTVRSEDTGLSVQSVNQLDHLVEPRDGGRRAWVRYVHSGILTDDWENQYDGAAKHNDFYLHTLRQYLVHFTGRRAAFVTFDGPGSAAAPDALERLVDGLGLPRDVAEGARVRVTGPDGRELDAVVDFRNGYFLGLRTDDAMYRFFGRNRFGHRLGMSVHDFAPGADPKREELAWQGWMAQLFG